MELLNTPVRKTARLQLIEWQHGKRPLEELIRERLAKGMSFREMSDEWQISYSLLYDFARVAGIPLPGKRARRP